MEYDELENSINELQKCLDEIAEVNILNESKKAKLYYQKKMHKCYNRMFKLKKHLEFLKKMEDLKNGV